MGSMHNRPIQLFDWTGTGPPTRDKFIYWWRQPGMKDEMDPCCVVQLQRAKVERVVGWLAQGCQPGTTSEAIGKYWKTTITDRENNNMIRGPPFCLPSTALDDLGKGGGGGESGRE